jgi:hypothetical protein
VIRNFSQLRNIAQVSVLSYGWTSTVTVVEHVGVGHDANFNVNHDTGVTYQWTGNIMAALLGNWHFGSKVQSNYRGPLNDLNYCSTGNTMSISAITFIDTSLESCDRLRQVIDDEIDSLEDSSNSTRALKA